MMIKNAFQNNVARTVVSALIPFVQLFALYVVIHGHYGPGGGFQGGVLLAISIILQRICFGKSESYKKFPPVWAVIFAAAGMLLFILIGLMPLFYGASFLDYEKLPFFWVEGAELRSLGILMIEIGITLGVFGTLVSIFDSMTGAGEG